MRTSARDPRYRDYRVLLDGKDISGYVTDADDVEGWVRCVVTNEQGHAYSTPETNGKPLTEIRRGQVQYKVPEYTPEQRHQIAVIETIARNLYSDKWNRQLGKRVAKLPSSVLGIPASKADRTLREQWIRGEPIPDFAELPYDTQLKYITKANSIAGHVHRAERELKRGCKEGCQCQTCTK